MAKKLAVKKPAAKKKGGKRGFFGGGLTTAEILEGALGTGGDSNLPVRAATAAGESGLPAVRGSRDVARPGRPSIDVDGRLKRLTGEKLVGSGSTPARPALTGPSSTASTAARASRAGAVGRGLLGGAGLASLALMPDTRREAADADKPRDYGSGEGLQPKRSAGFTDAADFGPPRNIGKTSVPAKAPAKKTAPRAKASADDAFMDDLRASAARMKSATADAAEKTGRMKSATEKFAGSFDEPAMKKGGKVKGYAKGGSVRGRGDGIAQRGHTKGKIW